MKKYWIVLSLLLLPILSKGGTVLISVQNQADFDNLNGIVSDALKAGEEKITVRFEKGVYYFSEKHINLADFNRPGSTLVFDGEGATLIGKGIITRVRHKNRQWFSDACPASLWRDAWINLNKLEDTPPFGPVRKATGRVEVVDEKSKLCRFPADEPDIKNVGELYLQMTQWYLGKVYKVTKITGGYIYFTADDLSKIGEYYNVEGDYYYGRAFCKYQLITPFCAPKRGKYIHCRSMQAFEILRCNLKRLEIRNFTFLGNGGGTGADGDCLIHLFNLPGPVALCGCTFRGIRTRVVSSRHNSAASYHGNKVEGCYKNFITIDRESVNTSVCENVFRNNQLFIGNHFDVVCRGKNFLVKDNLFEDFTYGAIGVGNHFSSPGNPDSSGIIEGNEMYYTEEFRREPTRTLMDSGVIYLWTKQDDVIIHNNYIHDYTGHKDNRGIFGDDGTCNTTVTGNQILRIANSYCIDFRRVASVETRSDSHVKKANVGIIMYDNTVDGTVRFEPRPGDKNSRIGTNKLIK